MVGIITYGVYIPRYRIKVEEIARVWDANASDITGGLGVFEKSVPDWMELSYKAAELRQEYLTQRFFRVAQP